MHKNFLIFVQNIIVLLGNTHQLKTRKKKKNAKCSRKSPKEPVCALQWRRRKANPIPAPLDRGHPCHTTPQPEPRWLIPCPDVSGQHPCVEVVPLRPDRVLRHCAVGAHPSTMQVTAQQVPAHTPGHHLLSSGVPTALGAALPQAGSNLETRLGSRRVWGRMAHYETLHQQRQPSSLLALENALQHPNPAVLQAPADGPANCQHATTSAPCVVLQRAILMAASNEQNWCGFVLFPFK